MTELAVRADRVSKTYRVYASGADRLRELLFRRPRHREFRALSDVSFELPRGHAIGLIGENGAGKSTLLKIVAGTTRATSGTVERRGTVASILELGMGFHPEFTGRENARLNAAILGLGPAEIRRRLPEIADFAELGDFMDRPVRTYSSGMVLRLAFSVATHVNADVLIVDEALSVGDGYFQKKSVDRITEFHQRGGTLLFCSHAMYYVAMLCSSAIWLRNGSVAAQGDALAVVREYESFLRKKECDRAGAEFETAQPAKTDAWRPARLTEVFVHDGSGFPRSEFATGEALAVDIAFETESPSLAFHVLVGVDRDDGMQAFAIDTRNEEWAPLSGHRRYRLRLVLPEIPLAQGNFEVNAYLGDEKALHVHDVRILKPGFTVAAPEYVVGVVAPRHHWTLAETDAASEMVPAAGGCAASS